MKPYQPRNANYWVPTDGKKNNAFWDGLGKIQDTTSLKESTTPFYNSILMYLYVVEIYATDAVNISNKNSDMVL
jgi:hypothetical protein